MSRRSVPSSRYVRSDESDQAGSDELSEDGGGDGSISFVGMGAGRDGGGIEEGASNVGEGEETGREAERLGLFGALVEGLSSGVGVDIGELVSWLDVSPVRPGG